MVREKILVRCDKCGSTNVVDEDAEEIKVTTVSMDEYIKQNRSKSIFNFGDRSPFSAGVSHMENRVLRCRDCGYTRLYDKVIYT